MYCKPTLKDFEPNIKNIAGVDIIVSDTISILISTKDNRDEPSTIRNLIFVIKLLPAR